MNLILIVCFSLPGKAQTLEWAKHISSVNADPGGVWGDVGSDIERDTDGNVYITGNLSSAVDFDPGPGTATLSLPFDQDPFLAKYDSEGNYIWAKKVLEVVDGASDNSYINVSADAEGNVYVSGAFGGKAYFDAGMDSLMGPGVFLAKYDSNGNLIWMKGMPGDGNSRGCVASPSGEVYIAGNTSGTIDLNPGGTGGEITTLNISGQQNVFIAKYDAGGNYIWAQGILGPGRAFVEDIAMDTTGNENKLCITGMFRNGTIDFDPGPDAVELTTTTARTAYIAKYDSNGAYIWANQMFPGTAGSGASGNKVAVDTSGNILITGFLIGSADFDPGPNTAILSTSGIQDMFLAKYDADGHYTWAQRVAGAGSISTGRSLALDPIGNAYVTGEFTYGAVDFDPGPGNAMLIPGGTQDMYVARYSGNCGALLSVVSMVGSSPVSGSTGVGVIVNEEGEVYITGSFAGPVDFDPGVGTSVFTADNADIFLAKLHFSNDSIPSSYLEESLCSDSFTFNNQTYTESGIYQQWVVGTSSCDSIILLDLTLNYIEEPVITINEFELGVVNSYEAYQWIKDGSVIPDATSSTYLVTENGEYQVAVTNEAGCADTSAIYIVDNVGINGPAGLGKQIQIYPNPASDILYINSPVAVTALLYSVEGRLVASVPQVRSLPLKGLANGMYLLQLTDNEGRTLRYEKIISQAQ